MNPTYNARPNMTLVATVCWDLNPTFIDPIRPERDGAWVQQQWTAMRAIISKFRTNYMRSGIQDAENKNGEWMKYSNNYGDVYTYAGVIIQDGTLDRLLYLDFPTRVNRSMIW